MQIQRKIAIAGVISFIALVIILFCAWESGVSYLAEGDHETFDDPEYNPPPAAAGEGPYSIIGLKDERILFLNRVDGYAISLPQSMEVAESSMTELRVVLEDEHRRMEIYKQPLSKKISVGAYISYSNGFLQNTGDHRLELREKIKINGYHATITQWSRKKLQNIENDKNYYTCIDIKAEDSVYTFFIKSDGPFGQSEDYLGLVEGFHTFAPTAEPSAIKFRQTKNEFWNAETKAFYEKHFIESDELSWGIFKYSAPKDMNELRAIEDKLDYEFRFLLVYKNIQKIYPPGYVKETLENAYNNGRTVELTLQTTGQDAGEGNMVYDVLDGKYDSFLYSFAEETAQFEHPVLFRLCNEMNGDWCPYSGYHTSRDTEIYKEFYKYVYKIFRAVGAENVIWVWNPNERSFPDFKWNNEILYYPGDEYVDIVGLTGYNTGTYHKDETWRSFTEIYDPLYEKAVRLSDKPLMITEFSSSSIGGDKEEWVREMFLSLNQYPRIKAAIWWDGCDWDPDGNITRPYFIDESDELTEVFKKYLKDYK